MTNPAQPSGPPPAPGIYQPDHQGPLPKMDYFRWIQSGVSIAVIALFYTGFVSPGFFRSQPAEQTATVTMPTAIGPTDDLVAPDIDDDLDPTSKAEIDQFISKLNLGDAKGATAMLCPQSSVSPDNIEQADGSHKLVVHSYAGLEGNGVSAEFGGPETPTSAYTLTGNVTAGPSPSGVNCVSSMYLSS